jgi:hypothetical protein
VVDLGRRVALEVHVGKCVAQRGDRVAVEREIDVRVLAVDHVDLREPGDLTLAEHVLDELLARERIGVLLLPRRCERAGTALHAADVRLVQIQFWTKKTSSVPPRCRRARSASAPSSRRSSDSRIATPSSKSRRSPASIFSRIGSSVS